MGSDNGLTDDGDLTTFSRTAFFSVLAALSTSIMSFYALWGIADNTAVNRAEEHGFDTQQLLPHPTLLWFAAHASLLSLLALDLLAFLAWRRSRSQPESPR